MKKDWEMPIMDELSINMTANGATPNEPNDGPWVQIGDLWVEPGCSR